MVSGSVSSDGTDDTDGPGPGLRGLAQIRLRIGHNDDASELELSEPSTLPAHSNGSPAA